MFVAEGGGEWYMEGVASLEQTAGNCFSFVCCGREGTGVEKCILLI